MRYLTIIIGLTGICFFACKSDKKSLPENNLTKWNETVVKIYPIELIKESETIQVLGIVTSESEARPSFKTGGIIRKTYAREGDFVRKGQLLATLEMDEINAQVNQAEEGFQKALRDKNRVKNLFADSVATLEQFQNASTAYEVAKRNSEIALFNQKYSEVRSPIDGKIVRQIMFSGEVTGPGNPIYAIIGTSSNDWVVKAGLTDRDWSRVNLKDKVIITMDAYPGETQEGIVAQKTSVGGNASGTFDVEIKFIKNPPKLAVGLTASATIFSQNNATYTTIPVEALVESNGSSAYAFTVENGKAKKVKLVISRLLGEKVAISSGLEGVKNVVTTGAMYLEEGDKVKY